MIQIFSTLIKVGVIMTHQISLIVNLIPVHFLACKFYLKNIRVKELFNTQKLELGDTKGKPHTIQKKKDKNPTEKICPFPLWSTVPTSMH